MEQYQFDDNKVILKVKQSPILVRVFMFSFAFLFFLMPLTGIFVYMSFGNRFHIGFLFGLFFFGIMGFYLLRIALWNTYGKEIISLNQNKISYSADYGWFKDGEKQKEIDEVNMFSFRQIGYEEEQKGTLVIGNTDPILCVTKMSIDELQELIDQLNHKDNIA